MKILHVISSVSLHHGGPSTAVLSMCSALAERGVDVHLATTAQDGAAKQYVSCGVVKEADGCQVRFFPRQSALYEVSFPLLRWLACSAADYDLIHVHAVFSHVSDWAPRIAGWHRVPYGITTHGILGSQALRSSRYSQKQTYIRLLVQHNIDAACFMHFTSERERRETERYIGRARPVVFPVGVPFESCSSSLRPDAPASTGSLRLLYLARLDPVKGLDQLFEAVALARQEGMELELVVAGDGEPGFVSCMHALCDRLQIADSVRWLGFVDGPAKQQLYACADVFVLSSYSESLGIAPLEAMATGLPVVISDRMGISASVASAQAGLVVAPVGRQIADALHLLNSNRHLLSLLGARGKRLAMEEYSLQTLAHNLTTLYSSVLHPSAPNTPRRSKPCLTN